MNTIRKWFLNELPFFTVIVFVICLFLPLNSFAAWDCYKNIHEAAIADVINIAPTELRDILQQHRNSMLTEINRVQSDPPSSRKDYTTYYRDIAEIAKEKDSKRYEYMARQLAGITIYIFSKYNPLRSSFCNESKLLNEVSVIYGGYKTDPDYSKVNQFYFDNEYKYAVVGEDKRLQQFYSLLVNEITNLWITIWKDAGRNISGLTKGNTLVRGVEKTIKATEKESQKTVKKDKHSQIDESKENNQFAVSLVSNDIELESLKKNYDEKNLNHIKQKYINEGFREEESGLLIKNFKILKPRGSQVDIINLNSSYVIVSIKLIGANGASLICADWRIKDNKIEIQPFSKITVDFACPADSLQMSQLKKIIGYQLVLVDKYNEEEKERRKEAERKAAAEMAVAAERAAAAKAEAERKKAEAEAAAYRKKMETPAMTKRDEDRGNEAIREQEDRIRESEDRMRGAIREQEDRIRESEDRMRGAIRESEDRARRAMEEKEWCLQRCQQRTYAANESYVKSVCEDNCKSGW